MKIAFVGHLSIDVNVVKGTPQTSCGGGIFYGSIAAHRLGAQATVYTKCADADRGRFTALEEAGVPVVYLSSATSTSIQNVYPSDNPDDRTSSILTRAAPFTAEDLEQIDADVLHINPLWLGEFPPELIPAARDRARLLGGDAQGFLRNVAADGAMVYQDWTQKTRYLPYFDLFKVDLKEAEMLTGLHRVQPAARRLNELGVKTVVLTHKDGVCVSDGKSFYEAKFGAYKLEGRTGRGDTCTGVFLSAQGRMDLQAATELAARVTSEKMQYRGPYAG